MIGPTGRPVVGQLIGLFTHNLIQYLVQYGNTLTELKTMVNSSKKNHHISLYEITRNTCLFLTMISMLMFTPLATNAKIYKWVDEKGNVHYGAEKPENAEAERVKVKIKPSFGNNEEAMEEKTEAEGENKDKSKKAEKPKEQLEGEAIIPKKEKAKLCKQSRERLKNIQNSARLKARDENGKLQILSKKERDKRLAGAKNDVKEYCQ